MNHPNGIPAPIEPNSLMELLKKQRLLFHHEARLDPVFFPEAEAAVFLPISCVSTLDGYRLQS